ncbi:hypothetical protein DSO57_1026169 [Entomophthora muscae]|uniref:Uncharacterized protein n=1 Tax=Entomophthora muscae TaxID=34485 RepID=A0ACC2RGR8_9FUNG|nr:hypothetical protein DSO57_1026169 [Entomophthora muscae]
MHPVIELLRYILYNMILNQIISGRWGPATGTLLLVPPNVNFIPANFAAPLPILENENYVNSQCPKFYAEDESMLSKVIYLGLLWLGLIVLLNSGVTIRNFTKKYLKLRWWLIINSMWIWVGWNKHIKSIFGIKPRYNTFYEHLKVQQGKTAASIRGIENRPSKKKRTTKEKQYQEKIKDVVKARYKLSEIGEYIKKITTVLNGNQVITV